MKKLCLVFTLFWVTGCMQSYTKPDGTIVTRQWPVTDTISVTNATTSHILGVIVNNDSMGTLVKPGGHVVWHRPSYYPYEDALVEVRVYNGNGVLLDTLHQRFDLPCGRYSRGLHAQSWAISDKAVRLRSTRSSY